MTNQFPYNDDCLENSKSLNQNIKHKHSHVMIRWVFFLLGLVFLALGIIGVVLPVLPTTPFVLVSAACFAKSSDKFYHWLINHRHLGKYIKDWEQRRAIPRKAKYLAWSMMTLSCVGLFLSFPPERLWVAGLVSVICLATAIWMARRPD